MVRKIHLDFIVGLVPLEELRQAGFDGGVGMEVEICFEIVNVGEGVGDIAWLQAFHFQLGGRIRDFFESANEVTE